MGYLDYTGPIIRDRSSLVPRLLPCRKRCRSEAYETRDGVYYTNSNCS